MGGLRIKGINASSAKIPAVNLYFKLLALSTEANNAEL
jgi:hypothetical protein